MNNNNFAYHKERLYNIRDILNSLYLYAIQNNKNIILYLREKFNLKLVEININILREGLKIPNSYITDSNFIELSKKYMSILYYLHQEKNNFIISILKEEAEVIEVEEMLNSLPEVPKTLPIIEKKVIKKKPTLLN